jgi:hypothetical protein
MIASKFLVSTATAVAVVGAIGIAYAQTTPSYTTPSTTAAPTTTPEATTPTPAPMAAPSTTATDTPKPTAAPSTSTDPSTTATELAVKADRN